MTEINSKVVAEIAHKSDTSEALFRVLATRDRNARDGVSRLSAIKKQIAEHGLKIVPQELLSTFRELERAGVGTLKGDAFHWHFGLKDVAQKALVPDKVHQAPKVEVVPRGLTTVVVRLDNARQFEATFPGDMTGEELKLIREVIAKNAG